jgi:heme exporter protein B
MKSAMWAVFLRDLRLAWTGGAAAPLGFFIGATILLPLAIGADPKQLGQVGPPLLWVTAALAALMSLERVFQGDLEDGALDEMLLAQAPFEVLVIAKGVAAWVAIGLPMALVTAFLAITMQAPAATVPLIVLQMAIGMVSFFATGLLAAALAASVRRGGLLIAILVLPFYAPPIIFGAAATTAAAAGEGAFTGASQMLAACALAALALGPIGAAAAARLQAE